ncbi:MAG: hypothetical protein HHAS10_08520 [Candidatus Altimarinota bacterium]
MGLEGLARLKSEIDANGLRIHGPSHIFIGDEVTPVGNITKRGKIVIPLGTVLKVENILVRSQDGAGLGFEKRITFDGLEGEFSPNKFKKHK